MKQRINISLSEEAIIIADESGNRSQYIEDLIINTSRVPQNQITGGLTKEEVIDLIKQTIPTHGYSVEPVKFVPSAPDPITGYPCCTKQTPCKHWTWDEANSGWKNALTGKIREVI